MHTHQCKVIILGDSGVGKSSILNTFLNETYRYGAMYSTIGVDFGSKIVEIDKNKVKLMIWDTAGQERYRAITRCYFRGANIALLVFAVDDRKSFKNLDKWIADLRRETKDCPIVLVGNKTDLQDKRKITQEEIINYAKEKKLTFIETNIKENETCQNCFKTIVKEYLVEDGLNTPPINEFDHLEDNFIKRKCC